jgi:radical SAM protein with 4Fe4S-binding SPASM domain
MANQREAQGNGLESLPLGTLRFCLRQTFQLIFYAGLPAFRGAQPQNRNESFAILFDGYRVIRLDSLGISLMRFMQASRDYQSLDREYHRFVDNKEQQYLALDRILTYFLARKCIEISASENDLSSMPEFHPKDYREGVFVAPDMLTFVDESQLFTTGPYFVRNVRVGATHYMTRPEYELMHFLLTPRSYEEVGEFYSLRMTAYADQEHPLRDLEEFYLKAMMTAGAVVFCKEVPDRSEARPSIFVTHPSLEKSRITPRGFPETIALVPTQRCNNSCRHCAVFKSDTDTYRDTLSLSVLKSLLDEMHYNGLKFLRITGGEPFMRQDIFEILEYAADKYFGIVLFTNGNLISDKNIKRLRDINDSKEGHFLIHLSLDGGAAGHDWFRRTQGAYERTSNAMQLLHRVRIPFYVEMTCHPRMMDEVEEAVEAAIENGAYCVLAHPALALGRGRQHDDDIHMDISAIRVMYRKVLTIREKHKGYDIRFGSFELDDSSFAQLGKCQEEKVQGCDSSDSEESAEVKALGLRSKPLSARPMGDQCTAGKQQLLINHNGDVYPCPNWVTTSVPPCGSVLTASLSQIWRDASKWDFVRGQWCYDDVMVCCECSHLQTCSLGKLCRIPSLEWFGTPYGPPPSCVLYHDALGIKDETIRRFYDRVKETTRNEFDWSQVCKDKGEEL